MDTHHYSHDHHYHHKGGREGNGCWKRKAATAFGQDFC